MRDRVEIRREGGRLVARLRPPGDGGAGLFLGLAMSGTSLSAMLLLRNLEATLIFGFMTLLALLPLSTALVRMGSGWRVEADPETVAFVREGLFGERRRSWTAGDVASFWVDARDVRGEGRRWRLRIGYRNGREEPLAYEAEGVDILRIGEALKDRPRPAVPRDIVMTRPWGLSPDLLPASVRLSRLGGGFEIELLPEGGILLRVALPSAFGAAALAGFAGLLPEPSNWILGAVCLAILLSLAMASGRRRLARGRVLLKTDAVEVDGAGRWPREEIEHVQTLAAEGRTELQLFLKGRAKARLLGGRPPVELEWLARFLRVALRGQRGEELRVVAKEGTCQVCGEAMTERIVTCARCRTPHHAECWSYAGQCSTFGCREIRCLA